MKQNQTQKNSIDILKTNRDARIKRILGLRVVCRCQGITLKARQCKHTARIGSRYCGYHGNGANRGRATRYIPVMEYVDLFKALVEATDETI